MRKLNFCIMFLSLFLYSCGVNDNDAKNQLIGNYDGKTDLIAVWNHLEEGEELEKYLTINRDILKIDYDSFILNWSFIIKEDNTYTLSYVSNNSQEDVEKIINSLFLGIDEYFGKLSEDISIKSGNMDKGPEMSPELLEKLKREIADTFNEFIGDKSNIIINGRYIIKNGKIFLSQDILKDPDITQRGYSYKLNGNMLTLDYAEGLTFTKR